MGYIFLSKDVICLRAVLIFAGVHREEDIPEKTIFLITTDGMENASRRYTHKDARERIQHQTDKYGWTFVYLGANITDATEARDMGFVNTGYMDKKDLGRALSAIHGFVCCCRLEKNDEDAR